MTALPGTVLRLSESAVLNNAAMTAVVRSDRGANAFAPPFSSPRTTTWARCWLSASTGRVGVGCSS